MQLIILKGIKIQPRGGGAATIIAPKDVTSLEIPISLFLFCLALYFCCLLSVAGLNSGRSAC